MPRNITLVAHILPVKPMMAHSTLRCSTLRLCDLPCLEHMPDKNERLPFRKERGVVLSYSQRPSLTYIGRDNSEVLLSTSVFPVLTS